MYYVVNTKKILPIIAKSNDSIDACIELLRHIDNDLDVLINNNVKLNIDQIDVSNYKLIIGWTTYDVSHPIITNQLSFDIINLVFPYFETYIESSYVYQKLKLSIKSKIEIITNKNNIVQPKNNIVHPKNNTVQTKNRISINATDHTTNGPFVLPPSNIPKKRVEPDVPRQMDSILSHTNQQHYDNNLNETVSTVNNTDEYKDEDFSATEILKAIEELKKSREEAVQTLESLKNDTKERESNLSEFCNESGDKNRQYRRELQKEQERKSKYDANKLAYRKMKKHIMKGKLSESNISKLFAKEYPIYKFMDSKDLLDKDDEYIMFLKLYNELYPTPDDEHDTESEYVPHNINYLNDDEKNKYKDITSSNKNLIDEFMEGHKQPEKKYQSIDNIFKQMDNGDGEINIDIEDFENLTK